MPRIEIDRVSKRYGTVAVLRDVSLTVEDGEYFSLLGNTGGGKTTLLHVVAGLVRPDAGRILIDGVDVTKRPPHERNLGLVFEQYALFPHYSVRQNLCYSRVVKAKDGRETDGLMREMLRMLHLDSDRAEALPSELSGGMQQRVALGRALMNVEDEGVLLLDEPFKALDAGLRMSLRVEVRRLAKSLGLTVLHVTNDTVEAMLVSDRVAIVKNGRIVQVGTPDELYLRPNCFYSAYFTSQTVFFEGRVVGSEGEVYEVVVDDGLEFFVARSQVPEYLRPNVEEGRVVVLVRNHHFKVEPACAYGGADILGSNSGNPPDDRKNWFMGTVDSVKFMGPFTHLAVRVIPPKGGTGRVLDIEVPTMFDTTQKFKPGVVAWLRFSPNKAFAFPHPGSEKLRAHYQQI
ncbi:MAG: hypothetical protein Kow0069_33130 [Promethearchaeota archaeon]